MITILILTIIIILLITTLCVLLHKYLVLKNEYELDKSDMLFHKNKISMIEYNIREAKEKKVDSMLSAFTLGLYSTFITEIRLGDIVATDQATVLALLEQLSTDGRILTTYIKEMRDYISETAIAVVATPSYTCPKCKEEQSPDENSDFKNLIPLNMVETFFDLCALRELKARKAIMS